MSSPAGLHRRPWLTRLRRALREQLFVLHYQPIVSLVDETVSHYEALCGLPIIRAGSWSRPVGSSRLPSDMG